MQEGLSALAILEPKGARCFGIWQIWVKERAPSLDTKGQTLSPARTGKTFPFSGEPQELINVSLSINPITEDITRDM